MRVTLALTAALASGAISIALSRAPFSPTTAILGAAAAACAVLLTALAILLILRIAWAPRLGVYLILMQVITTCLALLFSPAIILAQLPLAAGIGLLTVLGSEFLLTLDLRRPC